jgi:hypothetical protein
MPAPRSLPIALVLCSALALAGIAAAPASSAPTSTAVEPLPVNPVIQAEFEAHVREWEGRGKLAAGAREWEVRLAPALEGGWLGWCMSVRVGAHHATRCPVAPTTSEEIGYESWEAGGSGTRGVALVNAPIEAVAVDDASAAEATVPVSGVAGVSAALVEIPAPFPAQSHWFDEFEPVFHGFRSSGSRGWSAPEHAYSASLPASSWQAPEHPPAGACSITASHLAGLRPRFGHVATSVTRTPNIAGGGFASCVDIEYSFARSSLDAAVLLDAAQPGSVAPAPLPGAAPVRHHPGLFSAPGWNGQLLARRAGDAWLAVEGGASLRQRVRVLSHLSASVGL